MSDEWTKLQENLDKLKRNYTMTTPEQRRTKYKAQFEKFEKGVLRDASGILRDFCVSGWRIDPASIDDPDAKKEVDDLIERANRIIKEERAAGEMKRLGKVLLRELKVETFLEAACEKLYPRLWREAYGPYWVQQCGWIAEKGTYWNSLIQMLWDKEHGLWVAEDGLSWTLMLPPTMELIEQEALHEQEQKQ